ncbi:rhodanese domain-containing protein [Pycnococcus provasolii]
MAAPPPPPKHESVKFEWEPATLAATSSKAGKDFMDNSATSWKLPEVPLFEDPPVFIDENGFAAKPRQQEPSPSSFVTLPETPVAPKMSQPRSSSMHQVNRSHAFLSPLSAPLFAHHVILVTLSPSRLQLLCQPFISCLSA